MPDYQYTAREMSGQMVTGILSAGNEREVASSLATRQLFPVRIGLAEAAKTQQKYVGRSVRPRHLAAFYAQLADLLRSGVPLLRSLDLLHRQTVSGPLKHVLEEVRRDVADGTRLAEAMRQHPKVFSDLVVSMIRAGEEGAFVEDVLQRVAGFTEHQEELKAKVVGSMVYPVFLLVFGVIIVAVMLVKFVPQFEPIFNRLAERGELPWATTTLMSMSNTLANSWVIVLLVMIGAAIAIMQYVSSEAGRLQFDRLRLQAYGIGPIVKSLAIARFCRILGTLLKNGVPVLQSLRIAKDATGNMVLSRAIAVASDNVSSGKSLAKPLSVSGLFPLEVIEMIAVGEEANNLESVLINVADNLERNTNRQLELFVRMLEPILLIVMAVLVLFVVIALLLPVLKSSAAV